MVVDVVAVDSAANAGSDTLQFCQAAEGVTLHVDASFQDSPAAQIITASGAQLTVIGQLEHFIGSPYNDHVTVDPLPGAERSVKGGGHQSTPPGDTLVVNRATLPPGSVVTDTGLSIEVPTFGAIHYDGIETGVGIPNAIQFQGQSPPVAGSAGTLVLPADPAAGRALRWISSDSVLGKLDTGLVTASMWTVLGTNPQRLVFRATIPGGTISGNVLFRDDSQGVIDVVRAGLRIRYLVEGIESPEVCYTSATAGQTRFFVVDSNSDSAFRYRADGSLLGDLQLPGPSDARDVAASPTGQTLWVLGRDGQVNVLDTASDRLLGSWQAAGLSQPEGIATDGTDIWIVDAELDQVLRYAGAASQRSGALSPTDSFALAVQSGNTSATGITTNGQSLWVVDDLADRVFVYSVQGRRPVGGTWTRGTRTRPA